MSDSTQGEGWWQASDGKWYPPEQHPDFQGDATQPVESVSPTAAMPAMPPPPGAPVGPPPRPPAAGSSNAKWIIVGVVAVAAVAIAAFLLLGGDDKKSNVAATSSSSPSSTESSSSKSTSSSSKSSSSSSTSSSSSSSSSQLTEAEIKSRLIKAVDLGPDFSDGTFASGEGTPTNCGGSSVNSQVPPQIDVGNDASNGVGAFEEEVLVYATEADAKKALGLAVDGTQCPQPTIQGGGPATFSFPEDVSSDIKAKVDAALRIDVQTEEAQGIVVAIRIGKTIVSFQFGAQKGADTSILPNELEIVNKGVQRLLS